MALSHELSIRALSKLAFATEMGAEKQCDATVAVQWLREGCAGANGCWCAGGAAALPKQAFQSQQSTLSLGRSDDTSWCPRGRAHPGVPPADTDGRLGHWGRLVRCQEPKFLLPGRMTVRYPRRQNGQNVDVTASDDHLAAQRPPLARARSPTLSCSLLALLSHPSWFCAPRPLPPTRRHLA